MSYDIEIAEEEFNVTFNVAPMFYAAIPDTGIRTIYGLTGEAAGPIIRDMMRYFREHQDELRAMEPENKWGTFIGTYKFLGKLELASMMNPDEIWQGD
jgi:hypothetical protein